MAIYKVGTRKPPLFISEDELLKKEEKCIPEIVQTMRDKGSVSSPLRVRVAC